MADAARDLYDRRERYVWDTYRAMAARFYRDAAEAHGQAFWSARAEGGARERQFSTGSGSGQRVTSLLLSGPRLDRARDHGAPTATHS